MLRASPKPYPQNPNKNILNNGTTSPSAKKKILMLCDFYGESLTYQENLLTKYYVKHSYEVVVVCSTFESVFDYVNDRYDAAKPKRQYEAEGAKIIRLPYCLNVLNRLRFFPSLPTILETERPDLIFVHDIMLNLLDTVTYVRRNRDVKMIMDYHADYSNSGRNWLSMKILHGVIRKYILNRARPYLQMIFPVVPASAKFLNEVYGVPYDDMELLPLGTDMDLSHEVKALNAGKQLRYQYGIPIESIVLLTGGKLSPVKRTEALIEAFLQLPESDSYLFIVGDADALDAEYVNGLHTLVAGNARIHFTGWLPSRAMLEHLDMADIAAFPASQSVLWQQAIGMGLPLILGEPLALPGGAQDVSYLNLYENILFAVDGGSLAERLRLAISELLNNPERRKHMARGAASVAEELLDWNRTIYRTVRFTYKT